MQTQIATKELLVNPALIQENRRLRAENDTLIEENTMLRELVRYYQTKSIEGYATKVKWYRKIGDVAVDLLIAGRWAFAAVVFMVASWHIWMAVWGIRI